MSEATADVSGQTAAQMRPSFWPQIVAGLILAAAVFFAMRRGDRTEPAEPYLKCTPAEEWPHEPGKRRPPPKSFVAPAGTLVRFEGYWFIVDGPGNARMLPLELTPLEGK